ncbi:YSC84-related protein [Variovorax sp. OV329]|uniref:BPSL1445 family SYLF domain-containing lipoprotein n=1 Tax=Variovorax sp. OV329 TaxID=1882825 RepID=UPI0008F09A12|nr:YSC84-related protein [Variovorax sp. OV329]SFN34886.1 Lipid-binding SYLF domain-containing protein [Variovorax sp. OV329]
MNKRSFLATGLLTVLATACTTTANNQGDPAARRASIDSQVDSALTRLYAQVAGSRDLVGKARGVLVFPAVVSAGLIVGGSRGEGALRVGGKTDGFYSTTAASVGLLAGADSRAVFILFMTQDSLDRFRASRGWTAGVDASVTMLRVGATAGVDTQTVQQPVVGYVLSNAGLMANLSLDGTRINRLDL